MSHGMKVVGRIMVLVAVACLMSSCALKERSSRKMKRGRSSQVEAPQVQPADLELLAG